MSIKEAFASTLKKVRHARGLTQEDFSNISSRTYISSLERAIKKPTLDKIDVIAKTMNIHPVTLIAIAYIADNNLNPKKFLHEISNELNETLKVID